MIDLKYADEAIALQLSGVSAYPALSRAAALEMHRQVGDLVCDAQGVAVRGLIVAHLLLPGGLAGTPDIWQFIREQLSAQTWINLPMYAPAFRAAEYPPLERELTRAEYHAALRLGQQLGLTSLARYTMVDEAEMEPL